MKKTLLTIAAVAGASLAAHSQGQLYFENESANGYVVTSSLGDGSGSGGTYAIVSSFTAELWALPGPANTTSGLGIDAYGFLDPFMLISDGFSQVSNIGNIAGSAGEFRAPVAAIVQGTVSANTVVAVVVWTGPATNLVQALAGPGTTALGIMAFVQAIGPAQPYPSQNDLSTGWNALPNSPRCAANGGVNDLIMWRVPEPTTLALTGLGGLLLLLMHRKKA